MKGAVKRHLMGGAEYGGHGMDESQADGIIAGWIRERRLAGFARVFLAVFALAWVAAAFSADRAERFPVFDVEVEETFGRWMVQGQITNNSKRSYSATIFKLSFLGPDNKLLGAVDFVINEFQEGETATFEGISQKSLSGWQSFRLRLEAGM
jgi:hypothetical protein